MLTTKFFIYQINSLYINIYKYIYKSFSPKIKMSNIPYKWKWNRTEMFSGTCHCDVKKKISSHQWISALQTETE